MATPTLGSTPTTIDDAESTTGWTQLTTADTDLYKENATSNSGILRSDLAVGYYDIIVDGGSAIDLTGEHVRAWINFSTVAYLDTEANSGMEFYMYDGTNTAYWVAFGSDTYFGGWKNVIVDADSTPDSGSYDKTSVQRWGFRFNRTAAPANKINTWVDYIRYGDGYYATGGTSGDEIDLAGINAQDVSSGYGILEIFEGVYFSYGNLQIGNGATTTWFEMLSEVLIYTDSPVATGLYGLVGNGAGCRINIDGSVLRAAGTGDNTRFALDMDETNLLVCTITDSLIVRAAACTFKSGQTITGNTFDDCGQITHGGADMDNCVVKGYEGTSDTSALIYNVNADPDGEMDGMTFEKGTASTHAIEFGTTSPTTMTLTNVTFTGYNASDGQTDSAVHFKRTSGDVTLNISGGNSPSYKTDGATISIVAAVSVKVTAIDAAELTDVQGARVLLYADTGGGMPSGASVGLTRSGSTVTVNHTSHGLATSDKVWIKNATGQEYNGVFSITYSDANNYTYTCVGTPTSPDPGSPTSTFVVLDGTTDSNGEIEDASFNYTRSGDQPVLGKVRKGTATPRYKTAPLTGSILSSGFSATSYLVLDE
jgi:hypothetical protein